MMKRIQIFAFLLCLMGLTGCVSSGSSSPWDRSTYDAPAQQAPNQLTREALNTPMEGSVYTPYNSPAEQNTAQAQAQAQTQPQQPGVQTPYYQQPPKMPPQSAEEAVDSIYGSAPAQPPSRGNLSAQPALPPVKVALLLPLSGEHADLGQAMLQAAQLALFDMGYDAFELMPRDTRGTPQGAAQAAQGAATEGAQLILGPLFAGSVSAAKPVASRYNINMISFSTDWSLAGGNTYIMGFLPFAQVKRVTEFASRNGYNNIGILAPNTDYGNAVVAAYNSLAYRTGMRTADVVRFSPNESDTSTLLREFTKYDQRNNAAETGDMVPPLPFNAVLMPVGGDQARSIGNLLSYYDMGPIQVKRLGTGLWDDTGLATEPALEGAWFAAPSPDSRKSFERRYRELYGLRPPRLTTLAYDATALAAVLAKNSYQRQGRPSFDRNALLNPNGFAGIDGIFRFRPDGLIERGLAVLEYKDSAIRVIDNAPTTFQDIGY
ncbi:MAG: penicillin-binding protein activator [Rhodospirillales bacterium]|nr:penicillin-binding protein activator [Rhodospirillales bacterium]MCB9994962.1 penicillin-binding protein activator [Rhodospirillales bacterium]